MASELSQAYESFMHKPLPYLFSLISYIFYTGLAILLALAIYLNGYAFLEKFNLLSWVPPLIGILVLFVLYLSSGFYGAMLKGFYTAATSRRRFDTEAYLTYAFNNAPKFFVATLIVWGVNIIFGGPFAYALRLDLSLAIKLIVGLSMLFILFIVNYLFFYLTLALVLFEKTGVIKAVKAVLITSVKELSLIVPYVLYIVVMLILILPVIDLLAIFVLYPIAMTYAIISLRKAERILARYL